MQSIYAWLAGGSIYLVYICIVLDLAVGVVYGRLLYSIDWGFYMSSIYICIVLYLAVGVAVCKASMLNWLGDPSTFYIYMYFTRRSSGCSGMQDISAQLTGGSVCLLCKCIVLDLAVGVAVYKASMLNCWGDPSAFYIYVVYDILVVGVALCKASVLNGLRGLDLALDVVVWKASVVSWQGV